MLHSRRWRALALLTSGGVALAAAIAAAPAGAAADSGDHALAGEMFTQTNLVSDRTDQNAVLVDPQLQNPWGLAMSATSPIWVADNNNGLATLYSITAGGTGVTKVGLVVSVPGGRAATSDGSSPDGQVFNGGTGFVVTTATGSGPARFIFSSESGQITGWNPAAGAGAAVLEFSSPTAVYKGLTIATSDTGTFLYAANFHDGTVDVFNSSYAMVQMPGGFKDPMMPSDYAPFGIQDLNGLIYVTYAKQDAAKHDDVAGEGHGFIDVFTPNGFMVERLVSHGLLNSPWGMTIAPAGFGRFGGDLLVGDFGDGRIHAFDPFSGHFMGTVRNAMGEPVTIDNLWALTFGTASTGGTGTLLFSAGINNQTDGLLGALNPVS